MFAIAWSMPSAILSNGSPVVTGTLRYCVVAWSRLSEEARAAVIVETSKAVSLPNGDKYELGTTELQWLRTYLDSQAMNRPASAPRGKKPDPG